MVNTIIQSFDIWTEAQGLKSKGRVKSIDNISLEGIAHLRELILELAVSGKLAPQIDSDEPASILLEEIAKEKDKLIKEGKIKKQKPLLEILEEEKSFELPAGWIWTRWDSIALKIGDIDHKMPQQEKNGYPYVSPRDFLSNNGIDLKGAKKISETDFLKLAKKIQPQRGDIIYPRYGTIGDNRLVQTDEDFLASYSCCVIKTMQGYVDPNYQFIFSISPLVKEQASKAENKTTQPNVGIKSIQNFVVPLPPLEEQKRIVAKVDELMALCDKLEEEQTNSLKTHQLLVKTLLETLTQAKDANELQAAWQRMSTHFDTLFCTEDSIDQLKQTILQLAVMGKLVKQNPNDEPASVLLEKIANEKENLIKEGKIKKQKVLPEITEEEKPFELPNGWEVSRLGTFSITGTGATPSRDKSDYYYPPKISWVTSGETSNDLIYETTEKISPLALKETNVSIYPKGSLIIAMYGQGKTRGQVSELMIEAGTNQACAAVIFINNEEGLRKYLKYYFKKAYEEMRSHAAGGAQPNLNLGKVSNTIVPIPPIKEQQRIVSKIDELFALCDSLKGKIQKSQEIKNKLSKVVIERAVQEGK